LFQAISNQLPPGEKIAAAATAETIKIAFLGRPNAGKSTLVNQLLREERVIAHEQPGTTRSSIAIDFTYRDRNYILIDTAGMRRRSRVTEHIEKISTIKTLEMVDTSDVVLMFIDATENIADQDLKLISTILEKGRAMVLAINKWDRLTLLQKNTVKKELERRLVFLNFVDVHFISALHGSGIKNLFKSIERSYLNTKQPWQTSELNRILAAAIKNHPPPMVRGKEIKLRYAHIGHTAPPTIIVHGTRAEFLPEGYRRYLEKFMRQELRISGTPLKIVFRSKS
jgi:GTP-binding protein